MNFKTITNHGDVTVYIEGVPILPGESLTVAAKDLLSVKASPGVVVVDTPAPVYQSSIESDRDEIQRRFKLTCRKCGSEDVRLDIEEGIDYGGETGYSPGHITIGCNGCGQNDFYMSI